MKFVHFENSSKGWVRKFDYPRISECAYNFNFTYFETEIGNSSSSKLKILMWKLIQSKNTVKKWYFVTKRYVFLSYNSWGRGIENGGWLKMAKVLVGKSELRNWQSVNVAEGKVNSKSQWQWASRLCYKRSCTYRNILLKMKSLTVM